MAPWCAQLAPPRGATLIDQDKECQQVGDDIERCLRSQLTEGSEHIISSNGARPDLAYPQNHHVSSSRASCSRYKPVIAALMSQLNLKLKTTDQEPAYWNRYPFRTSSGPELPCSSVPFGTRYSCNMERFLRRIRGRRVPTRSLPGEGVHGRVVCGGEDNESAFGEDFII